MRNKQYKVLLVCHMSTSVGLGHLTRLLALAHSLKKNSGIIIKLIVFGEQIKNEELKSIETQFIPLSQNFEDLIKTNVNMFNPNVIVFDLHQKFLPIDIENLFVWLKGYAIQLVSIDSLVDYSHVLDLVWIPSFYFDTKKIFHSTGKLKSGWDSFLIQKRLPSSIWKPGRRVLILTGGSDVKNLYSTLPNELEKSLKKDSEIHWVQGPFSMKPKLPKKQRLLWEIHNAPSYLDELIVNSNYVLTIFGVSFFEVLQYGIPTVVFSPYDNKDDQELTALAKEKVAVVAKNADTAITSLINLMDNESQAKSISQTALAKMSINGSRQLARAVIGLATNKSFSLANSKLTK
jgi:spore coat polysaccharide biosynthesis predicted glycosyltransferase SpsG